MLNEEHNDFPCKYDDNNKNLYKILQTYVLNSA